MILVLNLLLGNTTIAQSCSNNNLGFNGNTATNTLTICAGTTGTTLDADDPAGTETYLWQVATSLAGTYNTVSPDPGSVEDWTISSTYYNTAGTYYFRRVVSANGAGCNGNSDVVILTVKYSPLVTNSGTSSSSCSPTGSIILYANGGVVPYTYSIDGTNYQAGNTFSSLGQMKDAIASYQLTLEIDPDFVAARSNLLLLSIFSPATAPPNPPMVRSLCTTR